MAAVFFVVTAFDLEFLSVLDDTSLIVVFAIAVFGLLELNHTNATFFISTGNEIPFMNAAIFSALAVVFLSTLSTLVLGLGVIGVVVSQGAVQLAWNNWYWPLIAIRSLRA